MSYNEVKLAEVASYISRGITPSYTDADGLCVINQKCIRNGSLSLAESRLHNESKKIVPTDKIVQPMDILVNSTGTGTLGRVAQVTANIRATVDSHVTIVRPSKEVDALFLGYAVKWRKPFIEALAEGSTGQTELSRFRLGDEITIPLPSLVEQQQIAGILYAIDCKINTNSKINDNLQQQVYALFDSWFVSFDQTDGKMPADWREGTLGEITTITSGKRPPMKQPTATTEVSIPLVGAASIMGFTNAVLYNEPILVTGRVGTHGVVQRFQSPCWTSDNTLVIKSEFYEYAFQALQRVDYVNMNRGSTQPLITQSDLKNVSIVIPTEAILLEYEKIAGTLMAMYESNRKENERLAVLRDTLLPRLMNGEIDVSNIEI